MTNGSFGALFSGLTTQSSTMDWDQTLILFGHSFFLGLILAYLTYLIHAPPVAEDHGKKQNIIGRHKMVLGASNILFLCMGLTGIMILVGNNLARALAIGATMALLRFRVKLGNKNLGSNLLFGIIVGVACGLEEIPVAYVVTGIYTFLQLGLYLFLKWQARCIGGKEAKKVMSERPSVAVVMDEKPIR